MKVDFVMGVAISICEFGAAVDFWKHAVELMDPNLHLLVEDDVDRTKRGSCCEWNYVARVSMHLAASM